MPQSCERYSLDIDDPRCVVEVALICIALSYVTLTVSLRTIGNMSSESAVEMAASDAPVSLDKWMLV